MHTLFNIANTWLAIEACVWLRQRSRGSAAKALFNGIEHFTWSLSHLMTARIFFVFHTKFSRACDCTSNGDSVLVKYTRVDV
jgi:hypothetical protein